MAKNEALDAVGASDRIATGIHTVATLTMCAKAASKDELELARRILLSDPRRDDPREAESIASTFNRVMDAAIESCNESAGEPTRAGRRARLAHDLDRAGVLIVDRDYLAELIAAKLELAALDGLARAAADARSVGIGVVGANGEHVPPADLYRFDDDDRDSLGAECAGGDFIGDVGRDPFPETNVND